LGGDHSTTPRYWIEARRRNDEASTKNNGENKEQRRKNKDDDKNDEQRRKNKRTYGRRRVGAQGPRVLGGEPETDTL
jgi:hypothetical protein